MRRVSFCAAMLLGLGCGSPGPPAPAGGLDERPSGTVRMADTLAAIYREAMANAAPYPYLNRRRAEQMREQIGRVPPNQLIPYRFRIAQELIAGGLTQEGIAELERLMPDAGISPDSITTQTKPLFDLLAVSYLRLGEQENCLDNPAADACILPLARAGKHTREGGAREAIARYRALLQRFPDDYGSRYLLNIAAMAIGGYPTGVPEQLVIAGLAPSRRAAFPWYSNVAGELGLAVKGLAGGLNAEDFNRDGLIDLFMTSFGPNDQVRFFLADGQGGYVERTSEAGLDGIVGGLNTVHADFDNDGYPDILILRGAWLADAGTWPNSLLRNRGNGTFEDVTFASGLLSFHPTQTGSWGDFNLDGCIDLFIGNESVIRHVSGANSHRSELFVNHCDGTFSEISHQVGIDIDDFVKGVVWGDVNNDGLPDLYVSVMDGPNRLYVNRGGSSRDQWRFEEQATQAGVEGPVFSFPVWFWDYDQDGWEDLLVMSYDLRTVSEAHEVVARRYLGLPLVARTTEGQEVEAERTRLYRNNRNGRFTDVAARTGVEQVFFAMGSNFGDLDNDGWLDFYVGTGTPDLRAVIPNQMFRNVGGRRFEEVTLPGGFGHLQKGHAPAFVDLDRDGDEDIYMVVGGAYEGDWFPNALFENPGWPGRSWVVLELEGRGKGAANRSAIGARVEVAVSGPGGRKRTLYRTVSTGGSFGAGSLALHIGLDRATRIDQVRVRWPDAARSETIYENLEVNRAYHIVQGKQPVMPERPRVGFRKNPVSHGGH